MARGLVGKSGILSHCSQPQRSAPMASTPLPVLRASHSVTTRPGSSEGTFG